MAVLTDWAETGRFDVPTLRLAAVGLVYAAVVYLLPNAPLPPPAAEKPAHLPAAPALPTPNERYIAGRLATDAGAQPSPRKRAQR